MVINLILKNEEETAMFCLHMTRQKPGWRESHGWIFIHHLSDSTRVSKLMSKCQLASVECVQPASNQSLHSKAYIMWQFVKPTKHVTPDIPPENTARGYSCCLRKEMSIPLTCLYSLVYLAETLHTNQQYCEWARVNQRGWFTSGVPGQIIIIFVFAI